MQRGYLMKRFLKFLLCILGIFFIISPVLAAEHKFSKETKAMLINKLNNSSLVVYKNGDTQEFIERGLEPLLIYLDKDDFKGTKIFDRTVGRAAAYLYVYGNAEYVYADTISKPAIEILKKNNIKYEAKNVVDEIQNKDKTDLCPFEKLTKDAFFGMQGGILFIFHRFMPENVRINRIVCIFAPNL